MTKPEKAANYLKDKAAKKKAVAKKAIVKKAAKTIKLDDSLAKDIALAKATGYFIDLDNFAEHKNIAVRTEVASNPNIDAFIAERLFGKATNEKLLLALVNNPSFVKFGIDKMIFPHLTFPGLKVLAGKVTDIEVMKLLKALYTPPSTQHKEIMSALESNPAYKKEAKKEAKKKPAAKKAAVKKPAIRMSKENSLLELAKSSSPLDRVSAADSNHITEEVEKLLCKDYDLKVILALIRNPKVSDNTINEILKLNIDSTPVLLHIIGRRSSKQTLDFLVNHRFRDVRETLAKSNNLSKDYIEILAKDGSPTVRAAIARNQKLSKELFDLLSKDKSAQVKDQLTFNDGYKKWIKGNKPVSLDDLAKSDIEEYRLEAASSKNINREVALILIGYKSRLLNHTLVKNKNLDLQSIEDLVSLDKKLKLDIINLDYLSERNDLLHTTYEKLYTSSDVARKVILAQNKSIPESVIKLLETNKGFIVKVKQALKKNPAYKQYLKGKDLDKLSFKGSMTVTSNGNGHSEVDKNGTIYHFNKDGLYHDENGPAVIWKDGAESWYINGKVHRIGAPAIINPVQNYKGWFQNGVLHREDGPAWHMGSMERYYIQGKEYTKNAFDIEIAARQLKEQVTNATKAQEIVDAIKSAEKKISTLDFKNLTPEKESKIKEKLDLLDNILVNIKTGEQPSVIDEEGTKFWFQDGVYHRENGPAIEYKDGCKEWYKEGSLHRLDGPAVEDTDGDKQWWVDGKLHRVDGPAKDYPSDGIKSWYQNGMLHNENGPAVSIQDEFFEYWLNGKQYTKEKWVELTKKNVANVLEKDVKRIRNLMEDNLTEKDKLDLPSDIDREGTKRWKNKNGELHRENGPAIESKLGSKHWYVNGKRHRLDGPACEYYHGNKLWFIEDIEYTEEQFNAKIKEMSIPSMHINGTRYVDLGGSIHWKNKEGRYHRENDKPAFEGIDGTKGWFNNGLYHRVAGPALEHSDGSKEYFINNKKLTEEEFKTEIKHMDIPAVILPAGTKIWKNEKKQYHRENDKPAVEYAFGDKEWWENDKLHRVNGPAIEHVHGGHEWWIDSKKLTEEEFNKVTNKKQPKELLKKSSYRFLARKIAKSVKSAMILAVRNHSYKSVEKENLSSGILMFESILESELGLSIISSILGLVLQYTNQNNKHLDYLTDEFQQEGIALAEEIILDSVLKHLNNKKAILDEVKEEEIVEEEVLLNNSQNVMK